MSQFMCKLWCNEKITNQEINLFLPQHIMIFKEYLNKKFKNIFENDLETLKY